MKKRIVITGVGILSPIGIGIEENWNALMEGKSGIDTITRFDTTGCPVTIAGEVKNFNSDDFVDKKEARRFDKFVLYAVAATELAMRHSKLNEYPFDGERAGVIIGSGIGGFENTCETHAEFKEGGYRKISPFFIPGTIINMGSGLVSIKYKLLGPSFSLVSACSTGTHAIGEAAKFIERGDADIMIAGGSEYPITPTAVGAFASMKALSRRNDEPTRASRPFDRDRDGFVMAEGASVVILESLEHAQRRGAEIIAEVVGYGCTSDAFHITAPDDSAQGARRCMAMAVKDAGINLTEVDY
ncbi:MAG: beta-ketoacyl-ACP synthase II, partial [Deferribacteraceae bacterium]|nr:beta-ketoacyl-ACP synthase II [Deferribacteraceae bacterium]